MAVTTLSPEFTAKASGSADEVCQRLQLLALEPNSPYTGKVARRHMTLTVREQDRHFWSPWLNLHITDEDGQVFVRGRFTPHPNIWTGFACFYFSMLVLAVFALIFAVCQWMIV